MEHERWTREREGTTHPSLVYWDGLDESEQDTDRDVVRAIPDLLAAAGLAIVRDE